MGFVQEFKAFAMKGNVVDMAVGIVIGTAFGAIVKSFVDDIIMPPIGAVTGDIDFSDIKITLKEAVDGKDAVTMNVGSFANYVITFLIVAFAIFIVVKAMNRMMAKEEQKEDEAPPPPTKEEALLIEIRDILARK